MSRRLSAYFLGLSATPPARLRARATLPSNRRPTGAAGKTDQVTATESFDHPVDVARDPAPADAGKHLAQHGGGRVARGRALQHPPQRGSDRIKVKDSILLGRDQEQVAVDAT